MGLMPDTTTYEEIAEQGGLRGRQRDRFLFYMRFRWPEGEAQKCRDGYAMEWCQRFFQQREYTASDRIGQGLLDHMDENEQGGQCGTGSER